jgi:crossover junction endodeoxyribonuclease RuvC
VTSEYHDLKQINRCAYSILPRTRENFLVHFSFFNMRVLGIDPGSQTTGWGVVEGDGRRYALLEFGSIRAPSSLKFSARLLQMCNGIEEVIARHRPDACALEDAFMATNVKVSMKLGQVRGVVLLTAERAALEIHEYSPRLIKQTVVGYGNAEKHQVQEMVRLLLALKHIPEPHDAADALAAAICHFHHAQFAQKLQAADGRLDLATALASRRRSVRLAK